MKAADTIQSCCADQVMSNMSKSPSTLAKAWETLYAQISDKQAIFWVGVVCIQDERKWEIIEAYD